MSVTIQRRGLMLVLSSPSGAGKSTLSRMLLKSDPNISMSVSVTTRPKRPHEVEGRDYFFVSPERFDEMLRAGEFLESMNDAAAGSDAIPSESRTPPSGYGRT